MNIEEENKYTNYDPKRVLASYRGCLHLIEPSVSQVARSTQFSKILCPAPFICPSYLLCKWQIANEMMEE